MKPHKFIVLLFILMINTLITYPVFAQIIPSGYRVTIRWVGIASSSWHNPANWSPRIEPNSMTTSVIIPAGTPYSPRITDRDIQVASITMGNNQSIFLDNKTLIVAANITGPINFSNAYSISGPGVLILNGSTPQSITGCGNIAELKIDNPTSTNTCARNTDNICISRGISLKRGILSAIGTGSFTLLSSSADTVAWLNDFGSNTGTYIGHLTVQRQIPTTSLSVMKHYCSAPVRGTSVIFGSINQSACGWSPAIVLTPSYNCSEDSLGTSSANSTALSWNEQGVHSNCMTYGWQTLDSTDTWAAGKGYALNLLSGSKYSLSGTPNTGNYSVSNCTNSAWVVNTPEGHTFNSGWSMVGNPYPSSINLNSSRASQGFDAQIQVYQSTGPYRGTYQPYIIGTATPHLAAFQGFLVHKTNQGGYASWPFYQNERTTGVGSSYHFYKEGQLELLTLYVSGNGFQDMTKVGFSEEATDGFDSEMDAEKFSSRKGQPTLFSSCSTCKFPMGINMMRELTKSTCLPIGFDPGANGTYLISIDQSEMSAFDTRFSILLLDRKTGKQIDIRKEASYTFFSNADDDKNRFQISFIDEIKSGSISNKTEQDESIKLYAIGTDVIANISSLSATTATVNIYDLLGQQIAFENINANSTYSHSMAEQTISNVIVKVQTDSGHSYTKALYLSR